MPGQVLHGDDYVAVLTSSGIVEDGFVEAVAGQLSADPSKVLRHSPFAVEIAFEAPSKLNLRDRFDAPVDINILAAQNRRKSILIADMDSTMIPVECIDELADFAGVKPQVAAITEAAMRGELDFEQAIDARVALLKDLPETALQECYDQRVALNPGARSLVQTMNATDARTALVSGGFTFFTERVAQAAGFHSHQANVLHISKGRLTGTVQKPVIGQQAKAKALEALCAERNTDASQVIAIGDGANDLAMIRAAGLGVAYRAKPALRAEADAILDHSDLSAVLALLGEPVQAA